MRNFESFFWGVAAALGALVVEVVFFLGVSFYADPASPLSFSRFFVVPMFIIVAAAIEETFKYLVIFRRLALSAGQRNALRHALLIGAGFLTMEMVLILSAGFPPAWPFLAGIAMVHLVTAAFMGFVLSRKNTGRIPDFLFAAAPPVFFHLAYNLLLALKFA